MRYRERQANHLTPSLEPFILRDVLSCWKVSGARETYGGDVSHQPPSPNYIPTTYRELMRHEQLSLRVLHQCGDLVAGPPQNALQEV